MRRCILTTLVLVIGCSGGGIDKENDDPIVIFNNADNTSDMGPSDASMGGDTGPIDLGGPITEPDGPMILDFSASPSRLTEDGSVNVTANLSDPQGFDDIGGGRVLDRNEEVVGVFQGSGGTFSFSLTWADVHALDPISFETEQQRVFTAEFFDAANHRARQSFAITLHCDGSPACDGTCQCPVCSPIQDSIGPCDPLCQTGCAANEACTLGGILQPAPQSVCVPAGSVPVGQPCSMDDRCMSGAVCGALPDNPDEMICVQICRRDGGDPSCAGGVSCLQLPSNPEIGVCLPQ